MAKLTAPISFKKTATKSPFSKLPREILRMIFKDVLDSHTDGGIPPLLGALEGKGNEVPLAAARYVRKITVTPENIKTFEGTRDPSLKSHLREITFVLPSKPKRTPLLIANNLEAITIDIATHYDNQWWTRHRTPKGPPEYNENDTFASLIKASRNSKLCPTNTLRKVVLQVSVEHENIFRYGEKHLEERWLKPLNREFGFAAKRTEDASGNSVSFTWAVEKGEALIK